MSDKPEKPLMSAAGSPSAAATELDSPTNGHVKDRQDLQAYQPRTSLGRRLWEIRARIIASGEPLLTWEDIDRELQEDTARYGG